VKQTETKPWRVITARELVEMELPQLEPLPLLGQEGFLYQGCAHLLVAHPKAGKTQVILHSACQWLEQGMRVAILYEEGQALMQYRLKTQASLQPVVRNELLFVELDCPLSGEVLKALDAELKADIYVVDTARAFLPIENENDNAELAPLPACESESRDRQDADNAPPRASGAAHENRTSLGWGTGNGGSLRYDNRHRGDSARGRLFLSGAG
jgi:hypothetical protein